MRDEACLFYPGDAPGCVGQFGWAVGTTEDLAPSIVASGRAPNAEGAVATALSIAGDPHGVAAAGIDAPLFWTPAGVRNVDNLVRRAMHARGAKTPSVTVQQLNALRGAVLDQGLVAVMLLRERAHGSAITETHPKAPFGCSALLAQLEGTPLCRSPTLENRGAIQTAMMSPLTWISKSG